MNKEWLMIAAMGAGGVLGAVGGTGFKPARRFILPFVLAGLAFWSGCVWWKCLLMMVGLVGAFCLPYGDRTPYWLKFIVGCAFVAPTLLLGFTPWQIVTPVAFIVMFILSNWKKTEKMFVWKIVEFLTFALVGIVIASLLCGCATNNSSSVDYDPFGGSQVQVLDDSLLVPRENPVEGIDKRQRELDDYIKTIELKEI